MMIEVHARNQKSSHAFDGSVVIKGYSRCEVKSAGFLCQIAVIKILEGNLRQAEINIPSS